MDLYEKDAAITRAMALALMRQALEYLQAIGDDDASDTLERAVKAVMKPRRKPAA